MLAPGSVGTRYFEDLLKGTEAQKDHVRESVLTTVNAHNAELKLIYRWCQTCRRHLAFADSAFGAKSAIATD